MKAMKAFKSIIILLLSAVPILAQPNLDFRTLGRKALTTGEYTAAAYFLYADYLRDTVSFEDHIVTAFLLTNEAEYDKAERMYAKVQDTIRTEQLSDSLRFFYYVGLAELAQYKHKYIDAIKYTNETEQYSWSYNNLRASCYKNLGLYELAINEYNKLSIETTYDEWLYKCYIGDLYRNLGNYEEAIKYFTEAVQLNPNNYHSYYKLGWCHELRGDDETALKYYNQGIERDSDSGAWIYLMRGEIYHKYGKMELAEADFKRVLFLDKIVDGDSCRQYALHFLGRDDYALQWMDRIVKSNPSDPGDYYDKACLCARMNLIEESNEALEEAFAKGYRSFAHIEHDDDLDPIRNTSKFKETIAKYNAIYQNELSQLNL